jgi:hypothetical protein
MGKLCVNGRIILKWNFEKQGMKVRDGMKWLTTEFESRLL